LELADLFIRAEYVPDVVGDLVGEHVGRGEIAAGSGLRLKLTEEEECQSFSCPDAGGAVAAG
jgi:hypothetical protein